MPNETIVVTDAPAGTTVLVTGGSGFIGGHVVVELLRRGYRVQTTIRNLAREAEVRAVLRNHVDTSGLTFFAADLMHDAGWEAATAGVKYVVHVASPMPIGEFRDIDVVAPAREGTRRVLDAAQQAGVARVVITSSNIAAMPGPKDPRTVDESFWTDLAAFPGNDYARAKTLAEQDAWAFVKDRGAPFELTTVIPAQVQGPILGADYSATVDVVRLMLAGKLPIMPRAGYNFVDVRDLAEIHIRAMTEPEAAGQRIFAASDFLRFSDMADILRVSLGDAGRRAPRRTLPDFVVRLGAMFNQEMRLLLPNLGEPTTYSTVRAERLLGRPLRPAREAILASAHSLLERGLA